MKKFIMLLALALLMVAPAMAEVADTVIRGKIYTADDAGLWAEALAVKDGKFVYVGDAAGAEAFVGEGTDRKSVV